MERRRQAALQHVFERGLEQVSMRASAPRPSTAGPVEQRLRLAADGPSSPPQLAFVQRVDDSAGCGVQRWGIAELLVDEPVLDHRAVMPSSTSRSAASGGAAGDVEAPGSAGRVVHPDGRASELLNWLKKWSSGGSTPARPPPGSAHAFGAASFAQTPPQRRRVAHLGANSGRDHVHDDAVGIGQTHGRLDVSELLVQRVIS